MSLVETIRIVMGTGKCNASLLSDITKRYPANRGYRTLSKTRKHFPHVKIPKRLGITSLNFLYEENPPTNAIVQVDDSFGVTSILWDTYIQLCNVPKYGRIVWKVKGGWAVWTKDSDLRWYYEYRKNYPGNE